MKKGVNRFIVVGILVFFAMLVSVVADEFSIGEAGSGSSGGSTGGSDGSGSGGGGGGGGYNIQTVTITGQISRFTIERTSTVYLDIAGVDYRLRIDRMNPYSGEIILKPEFLDGEKLEFTAGVKHDIDYDDDGDNDFSIKLEEWASARFANFIVEPIKRATPTITPSVKPRTEPRQETQTPPVRTETPSVPVVKDASGGKRAARSLLFAFIVVVGAIATVFIFKKRFFRLKTSHPHTKYRYVEMLKKNIDMLRKEGFSDEHIKKGLLNKGWPKKVVEREIKKKQKHIRKK